MASGEGRQPPAYRQLPVALSWMPEMGRNIRANEYSSPSPDHRVATQKSVNNYICGCPAGCTAWEWNPAEGSNYGPGLTIGIGPKYFWSLASRGASASDGRAAQGGPPNLVEGSQAAITPTDKIYPLSGHLHPSLDSWKNELKIDGNL